jgi:hypothetical protein
MTNIALRSAAPRRRNSKKLAAFVALSVLASAPAMAAFQINLASLRSLISAVFGFLPIKLVQLPVTLTPISGSAVKPPEQVVTPPASQPAPPPPVHPTLGVNLGGYSYYDGQRVLMNLAIYGDWALLKNGQGQLAYAPSQHDERTGTVRWLDSGQWAEKRLVPPEGAYGANPVRVRCVWQGKGEVRPKFAAANVSYKANSFEFDWLPANGPKAQQVSITISRTEPSDPARAIDCRETTASSTAVFSPNFLELLSGFKLVRFMEWANANGNAPVTWATRTPAEGQNQGRPDGMAVEHMVMLANEVDADAWFNMPWNADEDYVRQFAIYVRDHLAPDRKIYVEASNEVWNWMFPVTTQARDEGLAEGLSTDQTEALLWRYAEKSTWMFKIWSDVFKATPDRLVRVMAFQHGGTWGVAKALSFRDTKQYVDAIASAPYFGYATFSGARAGITDPDNIFAYLDTDIDTQMTKVAAMKAQAQSLGKRYIAYEGGQHLAKSTDPELPASLNRDPRMYDLYRKYLAGWQRETGDIMMIYNSHSTFSRFGSFGMREYPTQPMSQTPKLRAVRDFMNTAL